MLSPLVYKLIQGRKTFNTGVLSKYTGRIGMSEIELAMKIGKLQHLDKIKGRKIKVIWLTYQEKIYGAVVKENAPFLSIEIYVTDMAALLQSRSKGSSLQVQDCLDNNQTLIRQNLNKMRKTLFQLQYLDCSSDILSLRRRAWNRPRIISELLSHQLY